MKIDRNTVVILAYELRENYAEGRVVESIPEEKPLRFLYGAGVMLADFEINLFGKSQGDAFEFVVHHERGYGSFKEEAVLEVPKDVFRVDGKLAEDVLKIGTAIPMKDKNDKPMNGRILEIGDEKVKIDFNHAMAGKHLHFKGKIMEVREASIREIAEGKALD